MPVKRYGSIIAVKPEKLEAYKNLHANVWPDVLAQIRKSNISNYSIFFRDGLLFGYFEYSGENFDKDMELMAADPITQKWWALCKPCQEPLPNRAENEWWASMEELFYAP